MHHGSLPQILSKNHAALGPGPGRDQLPASRRIPKGSPKKNPEILGRNSGAL
jgi:hypothetical protein